MIPARRHIYILSITMAYISSLNCEKPYYRGVNDYPNLRLNPEKCKGHPDSEMPTHICDPDGILNKDQYERLSKLLVEFEEETPCLCSKCKPGDKGVKAYVALSSNIFKGYQQHDEEALIQLSDSVRNDWSSPKCEDDLLIFNVVNDKLMHTSLGFTSKEFLGADYVNKLDHNKKIQEKSTFIRVNKVLKLYKEEINRLFAESKKKPEEPIDNTPVIIGVVVAVLVVAIVGILIIVMFIRKKKMGGENLSEQRDQLAKVKIRHTGSVVYSEVKKDEDQNEHEEKSDELPDNKKRESCA